MTEEQFIKAKKLRDEIDNKINELKRISKFENHQKDLTVYCDGDNVRVPAIFKRVFITLLKDNSERNLANLKEEYEKL